MVDVFHIKYVIAPANSGRWVVICCFITTGHVSSVFFLNHAKDLRAFSLREKNLSTKWGVLHV
jgi:hypothetical protein